MHSEAILTVKKNNLDNKKSYKNVPSEGAGSKLQNFGGASALSRTYLSMALHRVFNTQG